MPSIEETQALNIEARRRYNTRAPIPDEIDHIKAHLVAEGYMVNAGKDGDSGQIIIKFRTPSGWVCHITYHTGGDVKVGPAGAFHICVETQMSPEIATDYFANPRRYNLDKSKFRYLRLTPIMIASNHLRFKIIEWDVPTVKYNNKSYYQVYGRRKQLPSPLMSEMETVVEIINAHPLPVLTPEQQVEKNARNAALVDEDIILKARIREGPVRNIDGLAQKLVRVYCQAGVSGDSECAPKVRKYLEPLALFWADGEVKSAAQLKEKYYSFETDPVPLGNANNVPTPPGSARRAGEPASDPAPGSGLSAIVPSSVVRRSVSRKTPTVYFTNNGYSTTPVNNVPIPPGSARSEGAPASDPASMGLSSVVVQPASELSREAGYGSTSGTASALLKALENGNESPENKYQRRSLGKKGNKSKKSKKETTNSTETGYNANNDLFNYNGGGGKRRQRKTRRSTRRA